MDGLYTGAGLRCQYPGLFHALSFSALFEFADMFWDVRFAMRHAGFLFRLPAIELTFLWMTLLGVATLIATLFWDRILANQRLRNGRVGFSEGRSRQTVGETLWAAD